jgi:tetratricopeptide (TPR) repeat protein
MINPIFFIKKVTYLSSLLFVSSLSITFSSFALEPLALLTTSGKIDATTPYQYIFNAAIQGDKATIKNGLAKTGMKYNFSESQRTKLSIMLALINENEVRTEELLTQFTADNKNNAQALIFAAVMWKRLSRQMGIFSYHKTYKEGLKAYIQAFEVEPDNDLYRSLAGSSYTMLDSDNKEKQRALLTGFKEKEQGFHLVALMDMAQNDKDDELQLAFAERSINSQSNNVVMIEQTAQAFWSSGNKHKAQQAFQKACLLPAPIDIFRYAWQNSCYIAGQLALNDTNEYKIGIDALTHLLTINELDTPFNQEIREMKGELIGKLAD